MAAFEECPRKKTSKKTKKKNNIAYRTGYQDGTRKAREDMERNKPFNANPRGEYDDRDHGYRREYGDKSSYKSRYSEGYRAGYESMFR